MHSRDSSSDDSSSDDASTFGDRMSHSATVPDVSVKKINESSEYQYESESCSRSISEVRGPSTKLSRSYSYSDDEATKKKFSANIQKSENLSATVSVTGTVPMRSASVSRSRKTCSNYSEDSVSSSVIIQDEKSANRSISSRGSISSGSFSNRTAAEAKTSAYPSASESVSLAAPPMANKAVSPSTTSSSVRADNPPAKSKTKSSFMSTNSSSLSAMKANGPVISKLTESASSLSRGVGTFGSGTAFKVAPANPPPRASEAVDASVSTVAYTGGNRTARHFQGLNVTDFQAGTSELIASAAIIASSINRKDEATAKATRSLSVDPLPEHLDSPSGSNLSDPSQEVLRYFCPLMGGFCNDGCSSHGAWNQRNIKHHEMKSDFRRGCNPTTKVLYKNIEDIENKPPKMRSAKQTRRRRHADLNTFLFNTCDPLAQTPPGHRDIDLSLSTTYHPRSREVAGSSVVPITQTGHSLDAAIVRNAMLESLRSGTYQQYQDMMTSRQQTRHLAQACHGYVPIDQSLQLRYSYPTGHVGTAPKFGAGSHLGFHNVHHHSSVGPTLRVHQPGYR